LEPLREATRVDGGSPEQCGKEATMMATDRFGLSTGTIQAAAFTLLTLAASGCGSGSDRTATSSRLPSSPTGVSPAVAAATSQTSAPTPTPQTAPADACAVVSGFLGQSVAGIINGGVCSAASSPVVLVRLYDDRGRDDGFCSGTVISDHAGLTAAHCLSGTASVSVYLAGREVEAASFQAIPSYRERNADSPDVGVVITKDALSRAPIPLLLSTDASVGDTGVIAGYGEDERGNDSTLRAGPVTITEVKARFLVTQYTGVGSNTCWGDSGGPLLLATPGGYAIAGVTSGGDTDCTRGMSDFARITNADISAFILGLVPNASRR
jgi:V8-like Glu-specific endopeptidase